MMQHSLIEKPDLIVEYEHYDRVMHVSDNADRSSIMGSEAYRNADLVITDSGKVIKNRVHPEFLYGVPTTTEPEPVYESFDVLAKKVYLWGVARNIIGEGTLQSQFLKLMEEIGEAFCEDGHEWDLIKDGIGDAIVVMVQMAGIANIAITKPLILASNDEVGNWTTDNYLFEIINLTGRIGTAIAKNNVRMLQALFDRLLYVFYIKAKYMGSSLEECLTLAYNEIKDRKGVLYKGVFVKSDDPSYPEIMNQLGKPIDQ